VKALPNRFLTIIILASFFSRLQTYSILIKGIWADTGPLGHKKAFAGGHFSFVLAVRVSARNSLPAQMLCGGSINANRGESLLAVG